MRMNWHNGVMVHSNSSAHLQIKQFAWIEMKCACGGSWSSRTMKVTHLHVSESGPGMLIGCIQHSGVHKYTNAQTRTHAHPVRYTPGPLEQALVTLHKSIQSLQSRRAERRVGDEVCGGLATAAIFQHVQTMLDRTKTKKALMLESRARVYITVINT